MSAGTAIERLLAGLKWLAVWLGMTFGITLAGALAGALLFPVGGFLFGYDLGMGTMLWNGLKDGGFYAFIWAPGVSFVVCVMLIRNKYFENTDKDS